MVFIYNFTGGNSSTFTLMAVLGKLSREEELKYYSWWHFFFLPIQIFSEKDLCLRISKKEKKTRDEKHHVVIEASFRAQIVGTFRRVDFYANRRDEQISSTIKSLSYNYTSTAAAPEKTVENRIKMSFYRAAIVVRLARAVICTRII